MDDMHEKDNDLAKTRFKIGPFYGLPITGFMTFKRIRYTVTHEEGK